jgi:hypothetical protein
VPLVEPSGSLLEAIRNAAVELMHLLPGADLLLPWRLGGGTRKVETGEGGRRSEIEIPGRKFERNRQLP